MGLTVEQQVLKFLQDANRPYNVQLVVDMLQKYGIKKGQVAKALDNLVEKGGVSVKEFGKVKIYFPVQDNAKVLPKEELEAKRAETSNMNREIQGMNTEVDTLKRELGALKSRMSLAELDSEVKKLSGEVEEMEAMVLGLSKDAPVTLSKEEQSHQLKMFHEHMAAWRKRRGIFNIVWDTISENLEGKTRDLFEEIGIENDEAAGCEYKRFEELVQSCKRRKI